MLEGFAEAGRAYRIRGSDYYDHHEDDMSDDELNDDEESDVTYQTPDKVIQQTKRKYRHSHGIGSCSTGTMFDMLLIQTEMAVIRMPPILL